MADGWLRISRLTQNALFAITDQLALAPRSCRTWCRWARTPEVTVSHTADKHLQEIDKKYPGFIHMKSQLGIKLSYQLQKILQRNTKGGVIRGFRCVWENNPRDARSESHGNRLQWGWRDLRALTIRHRWYDMMGGRFTLHTFSRLVWTRAFEITNRSWLCLSYSNPQNTQYGVCPTVILIIQTCRRISNATNDTMQIRRKKDQDELPTALNGFLYSLLRNARPQRRALILSLLKQFDDVSVSTALLCPLKFHLVPSFYLARELVYV